VVTPSNAFDELVSNLDYPMFIVTAAVDGHTAGCLAGFVTQASIDPPRLLVMLSKRNHTYDIAQRADVLVVHFLHADNLELARLFGEQSGDTSDKFSRCQWRPGLHGAPVLVGVRGWIAGHILMRFDAGDHVGHLLDVSEAEVNLTGSALSFQAVRDLEPGHEP
jgi:flavin reductase (DIM6/NTAB) family NADH-FMN oxidoreductase RutF